MRVCQERARSLLPAAAAAAASAGCEGCSDALPSLLLVLLWVPSAPNTCALQLLSLVLLAGAMAPAGVLAPVLGLGACARCLQGSGVSRECELRMGCRRFLPPPSSPSSESSPPLPLPRAPTRQPLKPPPLLLAPSRPPPPPLLLVVLPPPCCWPPVLVDSPGAEASVAQLTGEPA